MEILFLRGALSYSAVRLLIELWSERWVRWKPGPLGDDAFQPKVSCLCRSWRSRVLVLFLARANAHVTQHRTDAATVDGLARHHSHRML